jgi:polysaccharide deacetylase 2 family uncharacterized protein YibQ
MAEDDTDLDGGSSGGWMVRHPFLTSVLAGIPGALALGLMLPASSGSAPEDAIVTVAGPVKVQQEQAKPSDTKPVTTEAEKPALGAPPAPSVPIVAEAAVVIADTGLNRRVAEAIDKTLPRDITLAISVYANDPGGVANAFKTTGRNVWLQVAAQSMKAGIDGGPLAVSGSLPIKDNMALFKRQMAMGGSAIVGLYIPDDADITSVDPDMWRDIATNLIGENMMILDATPARVATSLYMQGSESQISAYLKTDIVVNGDSGPDAVQKALSAALPAIIKDQQAIVVLTHPTASSVQTLADWVKALPGQGIRLVPATKFTGLKP